MTIDLSHIHAIKQLGACDNGHGWVKTTNTPIEAWLTWSKSAWFSWLIASLRYDNLQAAYEIVNACISPHTTSDLFEREIHRTYAKRAVFIYQSYLPDYEKGRLLRSFLSEMRKNRAYISMYTYTWYHFISQIYGKVANNDTRSILAGVVSSYGGMDKSMNAMVKAIIPFGEVYSHLLRQTYPTTTAPGANV